MKNADPATRLTSMLSALHTKAIIAHALLVLWRLFQILVVFPSTLVGLVLLMYSVFGDENPVQASVRSLYQYAEDTIRPAPIGHVMVRECVDKAQNISPPQRVCSEYHESAVTFDAASEQAATVMFRTYLLLVVFSFFAGVFFLRVSLTTHKNQPFKQEA